MKLSRVRIGPPRRGYLDCPAGLDQTFQFDDENNYWAEAIDDDDRYYYRAQGCTIEIAADEYRKVISNPFLYYFSTALKLHLRTQLALATRPPSPSPNGYWSRIMSKNARVITAHDLLQVFLELRGMTSGLEEWSEQQFSDNPPRLIRLKQLMALFLAFEIAWDPSSFVDGNFIQPESPRYALLMREERGLGLRENHEGMSCFFEMLLEYRERLEDVLSFPSTVLAASGLVACAHRNVLELNGIIKDNVSVVDDMLVTFISPEARSFTVEQLARDYGYPDVDLSAIDAEWL